MNTKILKQKTGKTIQKLRKSNGLKQKDLAKLIDCAPSNVSKLEKGESFISAEILVSLCKVFNCNPKDLFDF